jgi:hypothetical protein
MPDKEEVPGSSPGRPTTQHVTSVNASCSSCFHRSGHILLWDEVSPGPKLTSWITSLTSTFAGGYRSIDGALGRTAVGERMPRSSRVTSDPATRSRTVDRPTGPVEGGQDAVAGPLDQAGRRTPRPAGRSARRARSAAPASAGRPAPQRWVEPTMSVNSTVASSRVGWAMRRTPVMNRSTWSRASSGVSQNSDSSVPGSSISVAPGIRSAR